MTIKKTYGLIASAGMGKRMGGQKKNYIKINDKELLYYVLSSFEKAQTIDSVIVGVLAEDIAYCKKEIVEKYGFSKVVNIVEGGAERQDTVKKLFKLAAEDKDCEAVVIHDGARPMVTSAIINNAAESLGETGAVVTAVKVKDTIKRSDGDFVVATLKRDELVSVQTPQAFTVDVLEEAFHKVSAVVTDESSLVEQAGFKVKIIEGDYRNIKVTTVDDIVVSESFLK